jgi:cellulose biosynthesis protein BcsQ
MRLAVVNLKGGTGKTTSATALAMSLSARGRTLLIDADPQGSALAWSEEAASRSRRSDCRFVIFMSGCCSWGLTTTTS